MRFQTTTQVERGVQSRSGFKVRALTGVLGMVVLLIPMLLGQFGSSASTFPIQKSKSLQAIEPGQPASRINPATATKCGTSSKGINLALPGGLRVPRSKLDTSLPSHIDINEIRAARSGFAPAAIPSNTPLSSLTFIGDAILSDVDVYADTDGNGSPNDSAKEDFVTTPDPSNEVTNSMVISPKTGRFYVGGANGTEGFILVCDNGGGTFKANTIRSFSTGAGNPLGVAVINTAAGDTLIVASTAFEGDSVFEETASDGFTLIAYPPTADGAPDGSNPIIIFDKDELQLGGTPVTFSLGGMATDGKGNLLLNVGIKTSDGLAGAIAVVLDSDSDGIPDTIRPDFFVAFSEEDVIPIVTTSIVPVPRPGGGTLYYAYGPVVFRDQVAQVIAYVDANDDLKADGPPVVVHRLASGQTPFRFDFSGIFIGCRIDIVNDNLLFSFAPLRGNSFTGNELGFGKLGSTGTATNVSSVLQFPVQGQNFTKIISLVTAGPVPADSVPPTVQVTSPNGGETFQSGTELAISWTSSDDKGVTSHDVSLSNDSGGAFPFVVATGLAGTAQSFSFPIPGALETPNARIQVTAKDSGGNAASDASDSDFVIQVGAGTDSQPPAVTVTSPTAGSTLNGGTSSTVNFSSTDNVGVISHSIAFAADGSTFSTTLATGLPGSATSFNFTVPNQATTTGVIRVRAFDGAGNSGDGLSGAFTVSSDTVKPTVTVTSPSASTKKVKRGDPLNIAWTSTDNGTIAKHDIQLSSDDGTTFTTTLATGLPGTAQSFTATAPSTKIKKAKVKVIATDAAGNFGEGISVKFKVK